MNWKPISWIAATVAGALYLSGCASQTIAVNAEPLSDIPKPKMDPSIKTETLILAGGCFWCVEAIYRDLNGVVALENGYAGGNDPEPTYQKVLTGTSGHAEVVRLTFDPKTVSREDLLRIFFTTHDPTTLNRQGNDVGTQYRSAIFYEGDADKAIAEKIMAEVAEKKIWSSPLVTTLEPIRNYKRAEEYHQDYFARFMKASPEERAKMNGGYCQAIIEPKVRKFRQQYADKLRKASG
jgi:peptide-methionine (S)-S-oxide reductase